MKRLAIALALGASIGTSIAWASPMPLVQPPTGWREDPEASSQQSVKAASARLLGDATTSSAAQAYFPSTPGIALFVSRSGGETGADHATAARAALDAFTTAPERAKLLGGAVQVNEQKAAMEASQQVVTLTWTDNGMTTASRLVIAANKAGIVAASGECVWSVEAAPALIEACKQALATVDTGIPVTDRVPVQISATAAAPPAAPPPSRPQVEPPRLDDSGKLRMTPIQISQGARETDRRPVYVGAGIVVLAVIFWFNRRRRDQIDRERAHEEGREPPTRSRATDDDADDLHAAARGDAPKDEDA